MTHAMQMAFRATKLPVKQFQHLMRTALLAGAISGALLFLYQYVVILPQIAAAEVFEAHREAAGAEGEHHDHSEWKPEDGLERTFFTAASTIFMGIGLAAILVSMVVLGGYDVDIWRGLAWGAAGFACFTVAPTLGMPPVPPGVPVADVGARQLWWVLTGGFTAIGLWLIVRSGGGWALRTGGGLFVILPHLIGAPQAIGPQVVPANLVREFAVASIAGSGLFWLVLGAITGWLLPTNPEARS